MGAFNSAIFMGHTEVVAAVSQAVVMAESVITAGDVCRETAIAVAAGSRKPIGAQLPRHAAAGGQGVLQTLRERHKTLAALDHLGVAPAAPRQAVVEEQMGEGLACHRDLHSLELGEIAEGDLAGFVAERKDHLRRRAVQRLPLPHPSLQGAVQR